MRPRRAERFSQEIPEDFPDEYLEFEEWKAWFESLSDDDRRILETALRNAPAIAPNPGPQTEAYYTPAVCTGYGGAAGGGKTALIAMLALYEHQRSIVYRADAGQVLDTVVAQVEEFIGTTTGRNTQLKTWRFPDKEGHLLSWAGLAEGQETKKMGTPYDFQAFDEATEVAREKVDFVGTWNRTTVKGQRCRKLMTFNPPEESAAAGIDPMWVIDYFAPWIDERYPNPAASGEIRYTVRSEDGEEDLWLPTGEPIMQTIGEEQKLVLPEARTFIGARVEDNPWLMATGYYDALTRLPEPLRSRMLLGDFRTGLTDKPFQLYPRAWIEAAQDRWHESGRQAPMSALGVDPSRGGNAATILQPRHQWWWDKPTRLEKERTSDDRKIVGQVLQHQRGDAPVCIDANGVGAGPTALLREKEHVRVIATVGQNSPKNHFRKIETDFKFYNHRTALMWCLRKILDPANQLAAALYPSKRLRSQMVIATFWMEAGKLRVTRKEDMEEAYKGSIDELDAVLQTLGNFRDTEGWRNLLPKGAAGVRIAAQDDARRIAAVRARTPRRAVRNDMWMTH